MLLNVHLTLVLLDWANWRKFIEQRRAIDSLPAAINIICAHLSHEFSPRHKLHNFLVALSLSFRHRFPGSLEHHVNMMQYTRSVLSHWNSASDQLHLESCFLKLTSHYVPTRPEPTEILDGSVIGCWNLKKLFYNWFRFFVQEPARLSLAVSKRVVTENLSRNLLAIFQLWTPCWWCWWEAHDLCQIKHFLMIFIALITTASVSLSSRKARALKIIQVVNFS